MIFYRILKGGFPSMTHGDYIDESEVKAEVERLETIRIKRNRRTDEHPAIGRGSAFLNMKDNEQWSYIELEQS